MYLTRFAVSLLLAGLLVSVCSSNKVAKAQQVVESETLYTFAFVRVPLHDALTVIMRETSIDLFFETEMVRGRTAHCSVNRADTEAVLRCVLQQTGLDYIRLSTGAYVLVPQSEAKPQYGRVLGHVVDEETGLPLSGANIFYGGSSRGTVASKTGHFMLSDVLPGELAITVTHVAYEESTATVVVGPRQTTDIQIALSQRVVEAPPIIVSGISHRPAHGTAQIPYLSTTVIRETPGSSIDMTRSLATISGVQFHDALSTIHIQGGDAGEHEFRLDGVPVFLPIRNGGVVGPFSPFAISRIEVIKAGFTASEGSATSGIISARHNMASDRFSPSLQFGPLSASLRLAGYTDIGKTRVRWMGTGRRSLWTIIKNRQLDRRFDSWSRPSSYILDTVYPDSSIGQETASLFDDGDVELKFRDLHGAVQINRGLEQYYLSVYSGYNVFGNDALEVAPEITGALRDEYEWFNTTMTLEYDRVLSDRVLGEVKLWKSSYILRHPFTISPFEPVNAPDSLAREFNEIETFGLKGATDIAASGRHLVSASFETTFTDDDFRLSLDPSGTVPPATPLDLNTAKWQLLLSVQDRVSVTSAGTAIIGSRINYVPLHGSAYLEPRISYLHDVFVSDRHTFTIRGAAGLYRRYINQFDIAPYTVNAVLPSFRFWIPLVEDSRPSSTVHTVAEILWRAGAGTSAGVEVYYKRHLHLNVVDYVRASVANDELITSAVGNTAGLSLSFSKTTASHALRGTYSFNRTVTSTPGRFSDESVKAPWSWPHQVQVETDVHLGHFSGTARLNAIVGRKWGYANAYYNYLEPLASRIPGSTVAFSSPERDALPLFAQVDIGLSYGREVSESVVELKASVLNVTGRKNVVDWILVYDAEDADYRRESRYAIPLTPLISLSVSR